MPADWQRPKYPDDHYEHHRRGRFVPLFDGGFAERDAEWSEGWAKWQEGLVEDYGENGREWRARTPDDGALYSHWAGERPSPDDYMPEWPPEQRTHLMMYETTSEGTPKSPPLPTPEELARWLADNGASAFGYDTATYEQWLPTCRGGWAPSAILSGGVLMSGVAALATSDAAPPSQAGTERSVVSSPLRQGE